MRREKLLLTCLAELAFLAENDAFPQDSSGAIPRPDPQNEVRLEKSRMVPMRDGVRLATDLYFPEIADEKLPVVLIRTPYNKNEFRDEKDNDVYMFASRGFVVAVQDSRGKFESEGIYSPPAGSEAIYGYDTVDWISKQSWSNGKVGMHGCSYPAELQAATAPLRHPNLTTIIPRNGPMIGAANGRYRYWSGFKRGVLDFAATLPWHFGTGNKYSLKPPPGLSDEEILRIREFFNPDASKVPEPDWEKLIWTLPLADIMNKAGAPPNDWLNLVTRDFSDPWWHDTMGYYDGTEKIDVPALHMSSWYDPSVEETIFEFNYFQENVVSETAANNQFLIVPPPPIAATNGPPSAPRSAIGTSAIGTSVMRGAITTRSTLIGSSTGSKVQYYTMGSNEWQSADSWPPPETRYTKYYLHSEGRANSRYGDGVLSTEAPGEEPPDIFTYDPGHPVPSVGGPRGTPYGTPSGAIDQGRVDVRNDVLVYTTPPLKEGIELTGSITAVFYVSSTAKDADFTGKLVDVYPDGTAYNLQVGILRARYREGFTQKVWMEEGGVYRIQIDMDATSNYFAPGHRIRLQVSSSDFPLFERNLNTGGNNFDETEWIVARNSVHHSEEHPSHLVLPIIPNRPSPPSQDN